MKKLPLLPMLLAFALAVPVAFAAEAPQVRGALSLAWDEYESGRCEAALKYIGDIDTVEGEGGEEALEDLTWLKVECLRTLGQFGPAISVLMAEEPSGFEWRDSSLETLVGQWAWEAQTREAFGEVAQILKRGMALLPDSAEIAGMSRVYANRREISEYLRAGKEGRLSGGGELRYKPGPNGGRDGDWVRVCPQPSEPWWESWEGCGGWLPKTSQLLAARGKVAWVRINPEDFRTAVQFEADTLGLAVDFKGDTAHFTLENGLHTLDLESERTRAAVEGLGIRGGALLAAAFVSDNLSAQQDMVDWLKRHAGETKITMENGNFTVSHLRTGRQSRFSLVDWAEYFRQDPPGWEKLWSEITDELAREKRPFHCFCGREMVLRETLTSSWEGLVPLWKGDGVATVLVAHCPQHWLLVTPEVLANWGATRASAAEVAARQAVETTWEVDFQRGREAQSDYLVLHGAAISGFVRRPGLLLGLLQAVEGRDLSETSVKVWVPLTDALVVSQPGAPREVGEAGKRKVSGVAGEQSPWARQVKYAATIKLPKKAEGAFNLTNGEQP